MQKEAVTRKLRAEKNSEMKKEAVWLGLKRHEADEKMHQLSLVFQKYDAILFQIEIPLRTAGRY